MKKYFVFLFTVLINYSFLQADYLPLSGIPHILRVNNPQSIGMALSGTAFCEGISSSEINPAGISFLSKNTFCFSFYPAISDWHDYKFSQYVTSIGFKLSKHNSLAISYLFFNFGKDYYDIKNSGLTELKITDSHQFNIFENDLSLGLSIKYLKEYGAFSGQTFLFDFGFQYKYYIGDNIFSTGCSYLNLGDDLEFDNEYSFDNPVNLLRLGIAYKIHNCPGENTSLLVSLEYQKSFQDKNEYDRLYSNSQKPQWHHLALGTEMSFFNNLFSRFGYNFNLEDASDYHCIKGFTYGIGFDLPDKIRIFIPIKLGFAMSKGLKDYRDFSDVIFSIKVTK